jgi:hypothetical protein
LTSQLPRPARLYVGAVIVIGLTLMLARLPDVTFAQPVLFVALLVLSSMTAALKVHLPLTTSGSTMSVSYAVDLRHCCSARTGCWSPRQRVPASVT